MSDSTALAIPAAGTTTTAIVPKKTPHYALPNTTFILPTYINNEQDVIRQSFSTGSYRMLHDLPNDLRPNMVNSATNAHADANLTSAIQHRPHGTYKRVDRTGLFHEFEYIPTPYDAAKQQHIQEMKASQEARQAVSKQEFIYSSARPVVVGALQGAEVLAPVMRVRPDGTMERVADVYDTDKEYQRQLHAQHRARILHGPFIPTTAERAIGTITRAHLPDIIQALMRHVDADWGDSDFEIYCDKEDLIIFDFILSTVDNPQGLLAYMNMMMRTNSIVSENGLSKLVELWNHTPGNGHLYFGFQPPFVKRAANQPYHILYPERRLATSTTLPPSSSTPAITAGDDHETVPSTSNPNPNPTSSISVPSSRAASRKQLPSDSTH